MHELLSDPHDRCLSTPERCVRGPNSALASLVNLLDPDALVLGGGLSRIERLYRNVPRRWQRWVTSERVDTPLLPPRHGDASGVRGAAWLW